MKRIFFLFALCALCAFASRAQQYTGMSGMLHIPSAEMHDEGDARIGAHFINKNMMPDTGFLYEGAKYHSIDYYVDITPFSWIEMAFTCTERKTKGSGDFGGYGRKDRYLSLKIRPFREGEYMPAIALGWNDVGTTIDESATRSDVQLYFRNYYVAASKHFFFSGHQFELTLSYRHFSRHYNSKWNGLVGGVTYRPAFWPKARAIVEYTGNDLLVGMDILLWRHLFLQASIKDFQYPSFGISYHTNLFGKYYSY